jgi:hypothetical protein
MNVLGLVFSLLIILSYSFYACWDKHIASSRLRATYLSHETANRKLLNSYQSEVYEQMGHKKKTQSDDPIKPKKHKPKPIAPKAKKPDPNPDCAKLNLWPLFEEEPEAHPVLYELAAKMIRTFYSTQKRFEYSLLDALIKGAKEAIQSQSHFALEKIDLHNTDLQHFYYKMLKGTKKWNLASHVGYPSLLDYVKAHPSKDKLCLFEAHPDLMTVCFNLPLATKLYAELHKKNPPLLTKELIDRIASETHQIAISQEILELFELGNTSHKGHKKIFIAEQGEVSLKKILPM